MQGGAGVKVTGSGTVDDPYLIVATSDIDISEAIRFVDTESVNFTVTGAGTATDPWTVTAITTVGVGDLQDVTCEAPVANDVLTWNGTSWVCAPISTAPGAINTGAGATGDGTPATPIAVDTVSEFGAAPLDVYGADSLAGAPVYVDANNDLRTPGAEGPYYLDKAAATAAGFQWVAGYPVTASPTIMLARYGHMIYFYFNGVHLKTSLGASSRQDGNFGNITVMTVPDRIKPFVTFPIHSSSSGRGHFSSIAGSGSVTVNAIVPNANSTTDIDEDISFNGMWVMGPANGDPYTAFAPIRDNAIQPVVNPGGDVG